MEQVAAIWFDGNDPQQRFERSIVIYSKENQPHYIRPYHGCYDPLVYPMFNPNGETGWEDKKILYQDSPPSKPKRKYTKRVLKGDFYLLFAYTIFTLKISLTTTHKNSYFSTGPTLVDLNDISEKNVHKEQGFFFANYFVFKAYLFVLNLIMILFSRNSSKGQEYK